MFKVQQSQMLQTSAELLYEFHQSYKQAVCSIREYIATSLLTLHNKLPYRMKDWREYYLVKHKRKPFGRINIGDSDKIISYMSLICSTGLF